MTFAASRQSLGSAQELQPPTIQDFAEIAQLVSDLDQLSRQGLIERIVDEQGVERFRPLREREQVA